MQPNPVGWVSTGDACLPRKAVLKMIIVGDGGVGKTTLIHRYLTGNYLDQRMTVGSGFATRDLEMDGVVITLSIWDFAGEERFRFLLPTYCRGALGCLLAFDLTRPPTFYHLDAWLNLVRNNTNDIPILLIGTKSDAGSFNRDMAPDYAKINGLVGYLETSSKADFNVSEGFQIIANLMWNRITTAEPTAAQTIIV